MPDDESQSASQSPEEWSAYWREGTAWLRSRTAQVEKDSEHQFQELWEAKQRMRAKAAGYWLWVHEHHPDELVLGQVGDSGERAQHVPKRPPDEAWQAWNLYGIYGNQKRVAEELYGSEKKEYQVSRDIAAVKAYLGAGGVAPELGTPTGTRGTVKAIDPAMIDVGERPDGRAPRQRSKRGPADD